MQDEATSSLPQPLTFSGVARFALASTKWLVVAQALVALLAGAAVAGFFEVVWVPVIRQTIAALPANGGIQGGELRWPRVNPLRSGTTFLWISVDPTDALEPGEGPDLHLDFGRTELRVRSLFGYVPIPYPKKYLVSLNRTDLEPWWGAWRPILTAGIGVGAILALFFCWAVLGLVYTWPARIISFYADRQLTWAGAWRLGSACLLPGALFLILSIVAYTLRQVNLVQLLAATVLHFMVGWVYVLCSPFCLPRVRASEGAKPSGNPFTPSGKKQKKNPFADESAGPPA